MFGTVELTAPSIGRLWPSPHPSRKTRRTHGPSLVSLNQAMEAYLWLAGCDRLPPPPHPRKRTLRAEILKNQSASTSSISNDARNEAPGFWKTPNWR